MTKNVGKNLHQLIKYLNKIYFILKNTQIKTWIKFKNNLKKTLK